MARIAVLSNVNLDPLRNHLQNSGFPDLYFGGYNQWQPELLNAGSGLYAFRPDYVFIYLNAEELQTDLSDLFAGIGTFAEKNGKTRFLVSNISYPPYSVLTYTNKDHVIESGLNDALESVASTNDNIVIFDFNRLIRLYGHQALFDDKYWYLGRIRHSNQGFKVLAGELKNVLACLSGPSKKVLIVDLDNTLWGGVSGEEGWQNIQLSPEGPGLVFLDFQKKLKQLQKTGVLLASCSKNNENDIREVFENNRWMQLTWDDFILHKINWDLKTDNIVQIGASLDLGLDSMVFLDDNPIERELVRQSLPEVAVPEFPDDISLLNRWFVTEVAYPFFGKRKLTKEDSEKTKQYKRNITRAEVRKQLDYGQFIEQLQIKLTVFHPSADLYPRIAQLTQKTNQFNLTGKQYSDLEIKAISGSPDHKVFGCEYEDKFGNEGVVGCAIVRIEQERALLDSFLLSCRVLGRRVEFTFLDHIIAELKNAGIKTVEAFYNGTPRNVVAKDLYTKYGFTQLEPGRG
jgi:FkbH-like protein